MNKDIKKLTLAEINKQSKVLDIQREFTVAIGEQEYKMSHDVSFRTTKKHQLLDDVIHFFSEGAENTEILELATPYTALLVLKHFTTLEVSNNISEALSLLNVLVDLGVLDKIVNELPEKEVKELYQLLTETVDNLRVGLEEAEEEALLKELTSETIEESVDVEVAEETKGE